MRLSKKSMKIHVLIWKLCGCWNWDERPALYPLYAFFIFFLFYFIFPLGMFVQFAFTKTLLEKIQVLCIAFTCFCGVKLWLVMRNRPLILKMFDIMDKLDEQIVSEEFQVIVMKGVRRAQLINVIGCTVNCIATCVLYVAKVFGNEEKLLIWPSYVPFEYRDNEVLFQGILAYQFISSMWVSAVHATLDAIGGSYYSLLGAHLEVLDLRMSRLGIDDDDIAYFGSTKRINSTKNLNEYTKMLELKKIQNNAELNRCVELHKLCVEGCNTVNSIMSLLNILQFGISTTSLCGIMFQLSVIPLDEFQNWIGLAGYWCCIMNQIYMPCWCASKVTTRSDLLSYALFRSNWIEQSNEFKTSMIIFVEALLKPIVPRAIGLFEIGLPRFVQLVKGSYSMMTFLKQFK